MKVFAPVFFFAFLLTWLLHPQSSRAAEPTFTKDLSDQTVFYGDTVYFQVEMSGTPPFHYEWRSYLGTTYTVYPTVTSNTFVLTNAVATFRKLAVVVSNGYGSITSHLAGITVNRPATIASQMDSFIVIEGSPTSLTATAIGNAPISYQWLLDGTPIPGRNNRTLNINSASRIHDGSYQVQVSNAFGTSTSKVARIHVIPQPSSLADLTFNSSPAPLPYRLFVPSQSTTTGLWPLVLSLHGAGEVGNDNTRPLSSWPHSMVYISLRHQEEYPCFFAAPQCPNGRSWTDADIQQELVDLVSELAAQYPVDLNRIYLTGLSMGGYGIWRLLGSQPDWAAAAVPMSGGGFSSEAPQFKDVPIWNFHSQSDNVVSVLESRSMIQAVRKAGGSPIYTEYSTGGHAIWAQAWATPDLVPWTMAQSRSKPSTVPPRIVPTSPPGLKDPPTEATVDTAMIQISGRVELWSEYDAAKVVWTNFTARTGDNAGTEDEWTTPVIELVEDKPVQLGFIAATTSWCPSLGGNTILYAPFQLSYVQPLQMQIRSLFPNSLELNWKGTTKPVRIESSPTLTVPIWTVIEEAASSPYQLGIVDSQRFFRVRTLE